jgi:hypothetical protein
VRHADKQGPSDLDGMDGREGGEDGEEDQGEEEQGLGEPGGWESDSVGEQSMEFDDKKDGESPVSTSPHALSCPTCGITGRWRCGKANK